MSIIHEALKKVQKNLPGKGSSDAIGDKTAPQRGHSPGDIPGNSRSSSTDAFSGQMASQPQSAQKKPFGSLAQATKWDTKKSMATGETRPQRLRRSTLHLYLFFLLLICFIFLIFWMRHSNPPIPSQAIPAAGLPVTAIHKAPFQTDLDSIPKIVVQGIMSREEQNIALINNNIYEEGDMIGEAKIVKISDDSIQVLEDEKVKIFKVQFQN